VENEMVLAPVTILGDASLGGVYILRMRVETDVWVRFGRFQGGEPVRIPRGEMLYLGSALRGLAGRVLRHALRCEDKPPQALFASLLLEMQEAGLINGRFRPPTAKKLHWHIDYLLEETAVSLSHVLLIRSPEKLEAAWGAWLLAQPETFVLAPGLGASDARGQTHLLGVQADERWWLTLMENEKSGNSRIIDKPPEPFQK
jgi:Uri superfamily endonuclease